MNSCVTCSLALVFLAGCTSRPLPVTSTSDAAPVTPAQTAYNPAQDVQQRVYERRVQQRADELYRSGQAAGFVEAEAKARSELENQYPRPPAAPDSVYAHRAATKPVRPALDQKALDAAAEAVARQRAQ